MTLAESLREVGRRHGCRQDFLRVDVICSADWGVEASLERIRELYAFGRLSLRELESWVSVTIREFDGTLR